MGSETKFRLDLDRLWPSIYVLHCCAWILGCMLLLCPSSNALHAQEKQEAQESDEAPFNIKTKTLGGKQFWTDHAWREGWRIQHNALTDHWRLIDPKNVRWAWGTRGQCQQVLLQQVPEVTIHPDGYVILLHGLMRSSGSMHSIGEYLQRELLCQPVYFEYASTRGTIAQHAAALADVIEGLPSDGPIYFIGHSMGNIVVRHYLGDLERSDQQQPIGRVQSVVMLGPPNQGAAIARQLSKTGVFGWLAGQGAVQLGPGWQELEKNLVAPKCPFGIVAGKLSDPLPDNPLVEGDSDFVVSVEEAKLQGAADLLEVNQVHSFLMDSPEVQAATVKFIRTHRFK